MVNEARSTLMRSRGYALVVVAVAALSLGARMWSPHTAIEFSGHRIYTDAWQEPNGQYWISYSSTVNCWITDVQDVDYWYEIGNQGNFGYPLDTVSENETLWTMVNGCWVDGNSNNNNSNGPGVGFNVRWCPEYTAHEGYVALVSLNDVGSLPGGDEGTRKDGPQPEENVCINFHILQINGPDEMWFWGSQPDVSESYHADATLFSATLENLSGRYEWNSYGAVKMKKDITDPNEPWSNHVNGVGLCSVWAKPVGRTIPGTGGLIGMNYVEAGLHASKSIAVPYPTGTTPIDWNEYQGMISEWFKRPYDSQRQVGHHYDENANQMSDGLNTYGGYCTLAGYHVVSNNGQNVPYPYRFFEYFTDTNNGLGWTIWNGENWEYPAYVRDNEIGSSSMTPPAGTADSSVWADRITEPWASNSLTPVPQPPNIPNRNTNQVDYVLGLWCFGTINDVLLADPLVTHACNWVKYVDHARHEDW